ncbi:protein lin-37 homolog [Fopius arisanus]|uniref:Protein lin-37 homolog n=1 Tax=Fopius arisanus TaxID=64838 RepID=A0A9R1U254_9HYME|nr:PREDICTED: protein lin-37 homolog [Fopius arisanus]
MGKRRSLHSSQHKVKVEVKDEIPDSEVHVARDRLKGALKELLRHSDSGSSGESSDESPPPDYKHLAKRMQKPSYPQPKPKIRRRRQLPTDQLFHHTYVMKLFDRSVDLAQFREDTPLYPICRAWMANQPRNPNLVPKVRSPSPEIVNEVHSDNLLHDENGELRDVYNLPTPLQRQEVFPRNRIPSPVIPLTKDELDLNYDGQVLRSREALMKEHRMHWGQVRRKWHHQTHKNEQRFAKSAYILSTIFKRAQSEFE